MCGSCDPQPGGSAVWQLGFGRGRLKKGDFSALLAVNRPLGGGGGRLGRGHSCRRQPQCVAGRWGAAGGLRINLDSSEFKDGLGVHAIAALLHLFGYTGPWDLGREGLRAAWRDTRRTALASMAQLTQRAADRGNGARLQLVHLRSDAFTSADQVAAYWVFCLRAQCVPDGPHPRDQRQILTVSSMLGRLQHVAEGKAGKSSRR